HRIFPSITKNGKGRGGDGTYQMIAAIPDQLSIRSDHATFATDQFVADKIKMIFYIFLKIFHVFKIIIISVITDNDIWVLNDSLQKAKTVAGSGPNILKIF